MSSPKLTSHKSSQPPRVVIIGGGVGGIIASISLKQKLGFTNFTIYEQSDDVGGTWHLNTYPGCASDVQTHLYSLSTEPNPEWKQSHVVQPELKSYWKNVVGKHQLYDNIELNTEVVRATWDATAQLYHITVRDVRTGVTREDTANAVISAVGALHVPNQPAELRGIQEVFKGESFHSARWRHDVDLHGKRVAVIGNGCSAAQFVPLISQDSTTQVTSFIRTPVWFLPRMRWKVSEFDKFVFRYVPFALRLYRASIFLGNEFRWLTIMRGGPKSKYRDEVQKLLVGYIKQTVPAEYVEQLTPKYPAGCKRFIIDVGYLESLHRPNNNLNFDGIAEVTEKGIVTKKGELHDFDVIIEATGFQVLKYPIDIRGVDGLRLDEYERQHGGPTAYRGTTVPGFPNFFLMFGPNMATGHSSVIFTEEVQANYVTQMLEPVIKGLASSFEVKEEASDTWNTRLQARLSTSLWSACFSWYRVGMTGKNAAIWPGPMLEQWWMLYSPIWRDYKAVGAAAWYRRNILRRVRRAVVFGSVVAGGLWWSLRPEEFSYAYEMLKFHFQVVLPNVVSSYISN